MVEVKAAPGGLRNVAVAESRVSSIDGARGVLAYRGIDIHELAEHSTFAETTYLLHEGVLPTAAALRSFESALAAERALPAGVLEVLRRLPAGTHPMTSLRTAVSALGAFDPDAEDDSLPAARRKSLRLVAQMATLVAPEGMEALIGGVTFEPGQQYLISATEGVVNYCGLSGPATPELQALFDQAFTAG